MKRIDFFMLAAIILVIACTKDTVTESYTFFRPVYKTKDAVRAEIKNSTPQAIHKTGKLVWKDNYVFLNDVDRGIHVIDVSNPAQIKAISFISIPGCVDLAINGNHLYADCYTDLVTLDITDPMNIALKQFQSGVFPHRAYVGIVADTTRFISGWVRIDTVVKRKFRASLERRDSGGMLYSSFSPSMASSVGGGIGIAGSMARFALSNQRLYTVSHSDLKIFNTINAAAPSYVNKFRFPTGDIETIFPYQDKLFIGSATGMFIYDAQNPDQPQKLGQFIHSRACDPVIADGNYAYVTLRGNGNCGGAANQLDVLDINTITAPKLVKTYPLKAPAGLSKDGKFLFICDGSEGLKILDAGNPAAVTTIKQLPGFDGFDVIAQKGTAIVVARDGLYVVDYTDVVNAKVIGKLAISANK